MPILPRPHQRHHLARYTRPWGGSLCRPSEHVPTNCLMLSPQSLTFPSAWVLIPHASRRQPRSWPLLWLAFIDRKTISLHRETCFLYMHMTIHMTFTPPASPAKPLGGGTGASIPIRPDSQTASSTRLRGCWTLFPLYPQHHPPGLQKAKNLTLHKIKICTLEITAAILPCTITLYTFKPYITYFTL